MNLPNLLSLFRLFITFFFILLVIYGRFGLALLLFVLQAVSDLLDGFFARRMHEKTALGAYLDPIADKVMLSSSYLILSVQRIVPIWLVSTVLLRDLIITAGFLVLLKRGLAIRPVPSLVSKATTVFQMLTIVYVLSVPDRRFDWVPFCITALLTAISGVQYVCSGVSAFWRKETV